MKLLFVSLLLPAVAYASIVVNVSGVSPHLNASAMGSDCAIISDSDIDSFEMTDINLKSGVDRLFHRRPDDVFVRSPTPWGDLYKTYNFKQVQTTLKPVSAKIISTLSKPKILYTAYCENKSTDIKIICNYGSTQEVETSVVTTWTKSLQRENRLEVGLSFELYGFKVGIGGSSKYTTSFGINTTTSEKFTVGQTSGLHVELNPGQSAYAELQTDYRTMQIEVEYDATLNGHVAANFGYPYNGHHFYALDVNEVLSAAQLPTKISVTQNINIGYFANAKIVLRDQLNGNILRSVELKH